MSVRNLQFQLSQIVNVKNKYLPIFILVFVWARLQSLFFCSHSEVFCILQQVTPVVTGDCRLNLSGSAIKLKSLIISSAVRKGYKSPLPTSN